MSAGIAHATLFSGIDGFGLAAAWCGWPTLFQVEKDPFCNQVLKKNFPNAQRFEDIREFDGTPYRGSVDVLSGGFPCQPFSTAGKRKGAGDDRYLWPEMLRVIDQVRPSWVVGENVAGILSLDGGNVFEQVCADLEAQGYQVQAFVLPAISQGAPHHRDRVWIVAHSDHILQRRQPVGEELQGETDATESPQQWQKWDEVLGERGRALSGDGIEDPRPANPWGRKWPEVAARLCGVDDGLPAWVDSHRKDRLKALGNAIVPQVAYQIFQAIETARNN